ncbi:hypothetical protein HPB49_006770 [Dermacentor silvarum]|uniref:Uncharacterized protein n=1 Tax=Dermacentor silvarum TaxID=543639 RepID=A0ACB8DXH1_DERSI|nr:hypothetical protein HPB49_006770 [Dermacentor silvarum]
MAAQIQWVKGQEKDVMIVNDKQGTLIFSTPDMDTVWKVTKIKSIKIEDKDYEVTSYLAPHEDNGRGVVHGIYPRLTIEGLTEAFCNPRNPPTLGVRKIGNSSSAIVTFKDETVPRKKNFLAHSQEAIAPQLSRVAGAHRVRVNFRLDIVAVDAAPDAPLDTLIAVTAICSVPIRATTAPAESCTGYVFGVDRTLSDIFLANIESGVAVLGCFRAGNNIVLRFASRKLPAELALFKACAPEGPAP